MEIQQPQPQYAGSSERSGSLREGETVRVQITERITPTEAVIKVRGNEVRAVFEGRVPAGDTAHVEVRQQSDDGVRVRAIDGSAHREGRPSTRASVNLQDARQLLREFGIREPAKETVRAAQRFLDQGVRLNRDTASDLHRYMEKGPGSRQEKVQTVHMLAQKNLEPAAASLRSVHETLHGSRIHEQVQRIAGDTGKIAASPKKDSGSQQAQPVREGASVHSAANRQPEAGNQGISAAIKSAEKPAVLNRMTQSPLERQTVSTTANLERLPLEIKKAAEHVRNSLISGQQLKQSIDHLQQSAQRSGNDQLRQEVNQSLKKMLVTQAQSGRAQAAEVMNQLLLRSDTFTNKESTAITSRVPLSANQGSFSPEQAIQKLEKSADIRPVLQQILSQAKDTKAAAPIVAKLEASVHAANQLLDEGRELKARQMMETELKQLQMQLPQEQVQRQGDTQLKEIETIVRNEAMQTLGQRSKQVLITEVTERLAKAADQFRGFQRDTLHQLQRLEQVMQQLRPQAIPQMKPMLENVISQLDKAINKSDWLLFADMKQERKLLGASSQLTEAKNLLMKGKSHEALQLVREVKQTMEQIQFKPANHRVQHFLTEQSRMEEQKPLQHQLSRQLELASRTLTYNDHSPRQVLEGMRMLGMNREQELAQQLIHGKQVSGQQKDLRTLFMQLARSGDDEGRNQAQQALNSLNGQQLLNRQDPSQQMHLFHLPMQLKGEMEELKVFVNSKNKEGEMDWENMSLYFHIETGKLGPLGITLSVTNKQLSIVLKNDAPEFENKVLPLTKKYTDHLQEAGFHVKSVKAQTFAASPLEKKADKAPSSAPVMTEKGFDYKI